MRDAVLVAIVALTFGLFCASANERLWLRIRLATSIVLLCILAYPLAVAGHHIARFAAVIDGSADEETA